MLLKVIISTLKVSILFLKIVIKYINYILMAIKYLNDVFCAPQITILITTGEFKKCHEEIFGRFAI